MLTARQMVAIATQSIVPPLHLSGLAKMYTVSPTSLRTIAGLIEQQQTFLEFEVRDPSVLNGVSSYSDLQANWGKPPTQPSQATLQRLATMLEPAGVSITYLSQYWHDVGIAGKLGALTGISAYRLDTIQPQVAVDPPPPDAPLDLTQDQWQNLASQAQQLGFVMMGGGALTANPIIFVLGAGLVGFGTGFNLGLMTGGSSSAASSAPPAACVCTPSGTNASLPIDPTDASQGVYTTVATPDAYAGANAPAVDVGTLPSPPPPTPAPGATPPPTPGPGATPKPTPTPISKPTPSPSPSPTPTPTGDDDDDDGGGGGDVSKPPKRIN